MPRLSLPTRLLLFACSAVVLACATRPATAVAVKHMQKQQLKKQVVDMERQWRTATLNADIPLMDRLLSDDYVGISMTGQVNTKAMQMERLRKRTLVISRIDLSDLRVKLVGSVAIVTSRAEVEGINEGTRMNGTFRYIRVYQRLPSGIWKVTNFEATRVRGPDENAPSHPAPTPPAPTPPAQ